MRFRLRTLMIVLALGPPVLAEIGPRVARWLFKPLPVTQDIFEPMGEGIIDIICGTSGGN